MLKVSHPVIGQLGVQVLLVSLRIALPVLLHLLVEVGLERAKKKWGMGIK